MPKGCGGGKTPDMLVKLLNDAITANGQSTVERETGLSHSMISRYKRGIGEPTSGTLKILSDYFGVSASVLRGDEPVSGRSLAEDGFLSDASVSAFDKFVYFKMQEFNAALNDSFCVNTDIIHLHYVAKMAKDILSLPEIFYKNIKSDVWEKLKQKAYDVVDKFSEKLNFSDQETRNHLALLETNKFYEKNNYYDLTTASDYYARLTSTFDVVFSLSLKSKLAQKNYMFLSVAVSLAKLVRDMPQEFKDIYDVDYINELRSMAWEVIKRYSDDRLLQRITEPTATPKLRNKN